MKRHSPSKLEALEKCPKFQRVQDTSAADEGTMLHKALETKDLAGLTDEQQTLVNQNLSLQAALESAWPGCTVLRETRVELRDLTKGIVDYALLHPDGTRAVVLDAKFGRKGATAAADNFQIWIYVAALMEAYPTLEEVQGVLTEFRAASMPTESIFTRDHVARCRARVEAVYAITNDPFSPPHCDSELCSLCAFANKCPELNHAIIPVARSGSLPQLEVFDPGHLETPQQRSVAQGWTTLLKNWIEQVRKSNTEYVKKTGQPLPGPTPDSVYAMVSRSTGTRAAPGQAFAVVQTLIESGMATADEVYTGVSISLPDVIEAVALRTGQPAAAVRKQVHALLDGLTVEGRAEFLSKRKLE